MSKKILSFGEILWDVYPDKSFLGGAPLNVSAHLSKHGEAVYLLSAVGRDEYGTRAKEQLSRWGVHTDYIPSLSEYPTGQAIVTLNENNTPSYRFLENTAYEHIPTQALPNDFDVLYFGTMALHSESNLQMLSTLLATHHFSEVFVDVNLRAPFYSAKTVAFAVQRATLLKISEEELSSVASLLGLDPAAPYEELARVLQNRYDNLRSVVITRGGEGAYARMQNGQEYSCATIKVPIASTVGAGDSFSAAFLHHYLQSAPIPTALSHATKVAALVVSHTEAVPDYEPNFI